MSPPRKAGGKKKTGRKTTKASRKRSAKKTARKSAARGGSRGGGRSRKAPKRRLFSRLLRLGLLLACDECVLLGTAWVADQHRSIDALEHEQAARSSPYDPECFNQFRNMLQ